MTVVAGIAGGLLGTCMYLVLFGGLSGLRRGVGLIVWSLFVGAVGALSATFAVPAVPNSWKLVVVGGIGAICGILLGIGYRLFNPFPKRTR
jgi:hypothetical protein